VEDNDTLNPDGFKGRNANISFLSISGSESAERAKAKTTSAVDTELSFAWSRLQTGEFSDF
jgi:hypothetical protein